MNLPQSLQTNLTTLTASLARACQEEKLSVSHGPPQQGDVVLWEASNQSPGMMTSPCSIKVMEQVRMGGSLLLTLAENPGNTALLLNPILPTAASATALCLPAQPDGPLTVQGFDAQLFGTSTSPGSLSVPFHHDIRPAAAVIRGQARYERYSLTHPVLHTPIPPNTHFWSKPLLNRAWKIRAWGDDISASPLLVTGQFGAGKVALLATSVRGLGDTDDAEQVWGALLRWLRSVGRAIADSQQGPAPGLNLEVTDGQASIVIENPRTEYLLGQLTMRCLTWEGALISDGKGEIQQAVRIAPHSTSTVKVPRIWEGRAADAALRRRESLLLRAGILSEDGSVLLSEKRLQADMLSPLRVSIRTPSLYAAPYPFNAPGPDWPIDFRGRMGASVGAYAFGPGQEVQLSIEIRNGQKNVAPLAMVKDVTQPQNESVMALNDEAIAMLKGPRGGIQAFSMWTGIAGDKNVVRFDFTERVQVVGIVLIGSRGPVQFGEYHNPGAVEIEMDGKPVASARDLDAVFVSGEGKARLWFPVVTGESMTISFPWVSRIGAQKRQVPWLGEIEIEGWIGAPPTERVGEVEVDLVDALTGERKRILQNVARVPPYGVDRREVRFVMPSDEQTRFYRAEVRFCEARNALPVAMLSGSSSLLPFSVVQPPGAIMDGFIVSRGFREFFSEGTGTSQMDQGWAQPDDLVWAYSRQFKEIGPNTRTEANRLYLTQSDMRHYTTPWRSFSNGELFFEVASQSLVAHLKRTNPNWTKSDVVNLSFSDRWGTGPALNTLHGWQDLVEFDKYLRSQSLPGLRGKTRVEISTLLHSESEDRWQAWQLDRYLRGVRALRAAFHESGKSLVISAQELPMVASKEAEELALTFRGMNDDSSFGMAYNNVVLTTGRQMAELAFNPVWQISTLLAWGFNSSVLSNWQWHAPVGTTEPSRRHCYDRAWRGTIWPDGRYGSLYTYGFSSNVGYAYTMTEFDWQQLWKVHELHSLISPEEPIGAGLIISTQSARDPQHVRFECLNPMIIPQVPLVMQAFRRLHEAGVSVPFATNVTALKNWKGTAPLIILNPNEFGPQEVSILRRQRFRGIRMITFSTEPLLNAEMRQLFSQEGTHRLEIGPGPMTASTVTAAVPELLEFLQPGIRFPAGTAGYGFRAGQISYIVVEDWIERARNVTVELATSDSVQVARACNVNDHRELDVVRDGNRWKITAAMGSGDALLIAVQEGKRSSADGARTD